MNLLMKAFVKGHVWLYESTNGKRGATMRGRPVLLLTTRGRKSGQWRTVPLVPFIDKSELYVMGSMAGAPSHPAWYLNLEASSDVIVRFGAERFEARAEILEADQRAGIWPKIVADMPDFAAYQQKTSRTIPVVRLARKS